jgi:membrane protease YdiL (CAAX protease family)
MRAWRGAAWFLGLVIVLSWLPAWWLMGAGATDGGAGSRLLRASLVYAAILGWQPVVAMVVVRRWIDRGGDVGVRGASTRFAVLSVVAPLLLLAAAAGLDALLWSQVRPPAVHVDGGLDVAAVASMGLGLVGTVAVLWLQAASEELGWRGYLLDRLMAACGSWPGLLVHGALWGLWYAPVFVIGSDGGGLARAAGFVVTCALLGTLLGWLRLASGSILASAASNATLTLAAGLPVMLQGTSSARSAIYEPAGWIPLAALLLVIAALGRLRDAVAAPVGALPELPDDVN